MPYTRAYQLPSTDSDEKLNITPSSNWIQETFNLVDRIEDKQRGPVFVVEKGARPSLYQKLLAMQGRSKLFTTTLNVSEQVPTDEKIKEFIIHADGDLTRLDQIKKDWEKEILERYTGYDFGKIIRDITEETIYLDARQVIQVDGLASIKFTVSSPELPTKGDLPITAILYSPINGDKIVTEVKATKTSGITGDEIPFSWIDKSGFESTILILPNVIYPIQPVSIRLGYEITLLA